MIKLLGEDEGYESNRNFTDMNQIYIFDICGTLYHSNTTFDFLEYFLKDTSIYYRYYNILRKTIVWRLFNKIAVKLLRMDMTRIIALCFLKGYTYDELKDAAQSFYNEYLIPHQNVKVIDSLKSLSLDPHNKIIIVSATLDFIADIISRHVPCQSCYSSQLAYQNGVCQGKLSVDLLGRKVEKIFADFERYFEGVYTDDLSDMTLLEKAKEKNIIVYPKTKEKWERLLKKKGWNANIIAC